MLLFKAYHIKHSIQSLKIDEDTSMFAPAECLFNNKLYKNVTTGTKSCS